MEDTLTRGAISKILTGERREIIDLKPVVQVMDIIKCIRTQSEVFDDEVFEVEEWYAIVLSDGSVFEVHVIIEDKINELIKAKQLVKGSIVQLTKFYTWNWKPREITIIIRDLNVICLEHKIIGYPTSFIPPGMENNALIATYQDGDIDLGHIRVVDVTHRAKKHHPKKRPKPFQVKKSISSISDEDHVDLDVNEDDSEDEPTASTQKCSSSQSQSKKRQRQSSDLPESCGKWVKNAGCKCGLLG